MTDSIPHCFSFLCGETLGYTYGGVGFGSGFTGLSGQVYFGHVENFIPNQNPNDPADLRTFDSQYRGTFEYASGGVNLNLPLIVGVSAGIIHFYSKGSSPCGVYGNNVYVSGSLAEAEFPGAEASFGDVTYTAELSNQDSYIEKCQVNIERLNTDIMSGAGSPHLQGDFSVILLYRLAAVAAATVAALNYNNSHPRCG